jgi:hypothetical protein
MSHIKISCVSPRSHQKIPKDSIKFTPSLYRQCASTETQFVDATCILNHDMPLIIHLRYKLLNFTVIPLEFQLANIKILTRNATVHRTEKEYFCICNSFFFWCCDPTRARASSFLTFLDHTQRHTKFGGTPLDEWSTRRGDVCLTTHNTNMRETSMPPAEFEPTISADLRLRPRGHRDWRMCNITFFKLLCSAPKANTKHSRRLEILVNDQLDAHFLNVFISCLYMFRATSAHHQEGQLVSHHLV